MEPKAAALFALAPCAVLASPPARAGEAPFQIRFGEDPGPSEQALFDVRQVGRVTASTVIPDARNFPALAEEDDAYRQSKIKIRWIYQPVEDGPRFEVGTYGSRKGAMKKKLIHIAMDWNF